MIELIIILLLTIFFAIVYRELPEEDEMAELEILTALVKGGMTPVGACAMGGNMMAESGMRSNNLQDSYQRKLGYTDETYTSSVDSGNYTRAQFVADQAGYGLCQWTYHTRKANLYDFARARGKSIEDEGMQIEFCLWEMKTDYPETWRFLQLEKDLRCCTSWICEEYERPAVNNFDVRYMHAFRMYKDYGPILEKIAKGNLSAADAAPPLSGEAMGSRDDAEPTAYIMGTVQTGEHTPEACFLMSHLVKLGYDVLWLGLDACLRDFQQKRGLAVDGICGEKTWRELLT